jgi:hypothetical protein
MKGVVLKASLRLCVSSLLFVDGSSVLTLGEIMSL